MKQFLKNLQSLHIKLVIIYVLLIVIGMQIIGPALDEATALRAADAYQRATDWHKKQPTAAEKQR